MARGSEAKLIVAKRILEVFEGSFLYNDGKEIRVPMVENGETVQIKVALTCAKENVSVGEDNATPGDFPAPINAAVTPEAPKVVAPSEDEKARVAALFKTLGL